MSLPPIDYYLVYKAIEEISWLQEGVHYEMNTGGRLWPR